MTESQMRQQMEAMQRRVQELERRLHKPVRIAPPAQGSDVQLPDLQYQGMILTEVAQHVLGGDFARGVPPVL